MKEEYSEYMVLSVIALVLSIIAIGGVSYIFFQVEEPVSLVGVNNEISNLETDIFNLEQADKQFSNQFLTTKSDYLNKINDLSNEVSNLKISEVDKEDLEDLEDELKDDIDNTDDEVNDIEDILDCMKACSDDTCMRACI